MDLIHKQDGLLTHASGIFGFVHHFLDFSDSGSHSREVHEIALRRRSDDSCQCGLAGAGRSPQNHGLHLIAVNHPAQNLSRSDQMFLADIFLNGFRPHAVCKRAGDMTVVKQ